MPAVFDAFFEAMDESVIALMGETGRYLPKDGEARNVTAAVDEESPQIVPRPDGLWLIETLQVLVARDAVTGIDAPQIEDGFRREGDDEHKVYAFSGERRDVSTSAWVLAFTRETQIHAGGHLHSR